MEKTDSCVDIPMNVKMKVVKELEQHNYVIEGRNLIWKGPYSYVYRARRLGGEDICAVKVILIPKMIDKERKELLRSIDKEVTEYR